MKDLLKTILSARKRADIHTNACMSRKGAACEAAHSPRMSEGVSACGALGTPARFGAAAAALMLAVAALFVACSLVVPQRALAYNPDGPTIKVATVDELLIEIGKSRKRPTREISNLRPISISASSTRTAASSKKS